MIYRSDHHGNKISQLGFGCMRFSKNGNTIDFEKAEREVMYAVAHGINYFDTAYVYSGSEACLGKILNKNHCRDRVYIATKLPQYMVRSSAAIEKIFQEELSRLQTDYIDYYLMHMFTDFSEWEKLRSLGIEAWIKDKKEKGQIHNIGFSYHGDTEMFLKILNSYPWDFCQIQYNYLDEHTQAGKRGLQAAAKKGIPVIIMEPLRGGKLVNLPEKANKLLSEGETPQTPANLGLRWLWDQPEVTCVLSGMNSLSMVRENIRTASRCMPHSFTAEERSRVEKIKKIIREKEKVGCTGCRYCMPCPRGVDIPGNFYYYNLMSIESKSSARFAFAQNIGIRKNPGFASQCVECGRCEKHCPQKIKIRQMLKKADKALRPLPYRIGINVARRVMLPSAKQKTSEAKGS